MRTCTMELYGPPPPPPVATDFGPGAEAHAILAEMGFAISDVCPCQARIASMNTWGVAGCRENRETIVGWFREASEKTGWVKKLLAAPRAAMKIPARHWIDVPGWLTDEAIRRAEGKI